MPHRVDYLRALDERCRLPCKLAPACNRQLPGPLAFLCTLDRCQHLTAPKSIVEIQLPDLKMLGPAPGGAKLRRCCLPLVVCPCLALLSLLHQMHVLLCSLTTC